MAPLSLRLARAESYDQPRLMEGPPTSPRTSTQLFLVLSLLLLGPVFDVAREINQASGIDVYNFWMLAKSRAASMEELTSPYVAPQSYAGVMNAQADRIWRRAGAPADAKKRARKAVAEINKIAPNATPRQIDLLNDHFRFLVANGRRRNLDPTAPPLLYAFFAFLPEDYDEALDAFRALQCLCFFFGALLLWRAGGGALASGTAVALALMVSLLPFRTDIQVANLSSIHLFFCALPLAVACGPLRRATGSTSRSLWAAVTLVLLAFYVLLKPNFGLVAAGLGLHVLHAQGVRGSVRAVALAIPGVAALALWPCLFFRSFNVWGDWLAYIGSDPEKLSYPIRADNLSTALHLHHLVGGPTLLFTAGIGLVLLVSLGFAAQRAHGPTPWARSRNGWARLVSDPFAAATTGLVATFATAPLVWSHYTLFVVVPLAWVLPRSRARTADLWLIALSALVYSQSYLGILRMAGLALGTQDVRSVVTFAWIPLWIGVLVWLARAGGAHASAGDP